MINSGTVNKQAGQVTTAFTNYNTQITGLSGSWEGPSYDNLVSKAEEFSSSYKSTVEQQLTSFAEACDLYKEYEEAKKSKEGYQQDLQSAQNSYNQAKKDKSPKMIYYSVQINKFDNLIKEMETEMENLKKEIDSKLSSISEKLDKGSAPSAGGAASIVGDIDMSEFKASGNLVADGDNLVLPGDLQGAADVFGSQCDNNGMYPAGGELCDDYARAYCLYLQTGKAPDQASVATDGCGLKSNQTNPDSRKEQAEFVYDRLTNEGKPSVIHIHSPSGKGHWVTVVGYKKGTTKESVKVDDFIIMDPANGKVRNLSEVPEYTKESMDYVYDPGYHINYYD